MTEQHLYQNSRVKNLSTNVSNCRIKKIVATPSVRNCESKVTQRTAKQTYIYTKMNEMEPANSRVKNRANWDILNLTKFRDGIKNSNHQYLGILRQVLLDPNLNTKLQLLRLRLRLQLLILVP